MDRNSIIAIVLIGLVIILWPLYQRKVIGIDPSAQNTVQNQQILSDSLNQQNEATERQITEQPAAIESRSVLATPENYAEAQEVTVQNQHFKMTLSSVGGGSVTKFYLKHYLDVSGDPVNLIQMPPKPNLGITFTYGGRINYELSHIVFETMEQAISVSGDDTTKIIRFKHSFDRGKSIEKIFTVYPDVHDIDLRVIFSGMDSQPPGDGYFIDWNGGLASTEPNKKDDLNYYQAFAIQAGEELKTKDKNTGIQEGQTDWVAIRNKYFLMALMPQNTKGTWARLLGEKITKTDEHQETYEWKDMTTELGMPLKAMPVEEARFKLLLGPMEYQLLKSYDNDLARLMNFGMPLIKVFSIPFYHVLQWIYSKIQNYGWAIIIFAIAIKIILYPLTRKSFKSMKEMQALQPKIKELQEKYKKDPQKLNTETMKLYKEHGVNPMGGCLPMLLQMPILIALFNLFRTTIMLRQAPFYMIQDLSAPDALIPIAGGINILPLIMGVTMIIQQRLTMQDPKQKAMAYMMPVMFIFFFYKVAAGLNLYYLVFNLVTIAQELIVRRSKK